MNNATHDFCQLIEDHMTELTRENTYIIGDFNYNTLIPNNNTMMFLNLMMCNGFYICNKTIPTRLISNTCIDHLYTNNISNNLTINYIPYNNFDHKIQLVEIHTKVHKQATVRNKIKITKTNFTMIEHMIKTNNIRNLYDNNINKFYDELIHKIYNIIQDCTTTKYIEINNQSFKKTMDRQRIN